MDNADDKLDDFARRFRQAVLIVTGQSQKAAEALRDDTKLKIKQFREVGERRLFIDQVNADRKELHGSLSNLALKSANLASDFAQGFFKPADAGEEEAEETSESVSIEIKRLEMALEEKRARLVELQKAADDAAEKAQKKAETHAKLDAINKEIEDKQKAAKALLDELNGE